MSEPAPDRLFAALEATWPAARYLREGPWTLREGRGGGQRVSAATADRQTEPADIDLAEEKMRQLGQRPLFMVRGHEKALDGWLAARGYDIVDPVTMYLAPSKALSGDLPLTAVIPSWPPLAVQREIWADGGVGPARLDIMDRVSGPKTTLLGRRGDAPAATAFVAADGDIAMLHALEVVPTERGHGIGRKTITAFANWAEKHGATWLALAVTTANRAANALYRNAGMVPAATYHCRRAPEASS